MGVDYRYYLIPKARAFLPEASQVNSFLRQAEGDAWLRSRYPGCITKRAEGQKTRREAIKLENVPSVLTELWNSGIRMGWRLWRRDHDIPYDLEIHASSLEYVYHTSETVDWFGDSVNCSQCGTRLDHEAATYMFGIAAIYANCPQCGRLFDPSDLPATYTHGWTGEKSVLPGGITYRFALVIDNVPPEEWENFQVGSDFVKLARQAFGCELHAFTDAN